MGEESKSHLRYVVKLFVKELVVGLILGGLFAYFLRTQLEFVNFELYIQALVALNSGIIIAMFVALFHSTNENIANFKKFSTAAKQVYLIFLINSIVVCFISLFMNNIDNDTPHSVVSISMTSNLLAGFIAGAASGVNVYLVYKLLQINFRH